jgi:hypothetical protein
MLDKTLASQEIRTVVLRQLVVHNPPKPSFSAVDMPPSELLALVAHQLCS